MVLVCAKSYFDSLMRLHPTDQARVNGFVVKLMENPTSVGINVHPINDSKYKRMSGNMHSGYANDELRVILWKEGDTYTLIHAGHHDPAYRWAERRRVERHVTTGALQLIASTEVVERQLVAHPPEPDVEPLLSGRTEGDLLALGVPPEWADVLLRLTDEDAFMAAIEGDELPEDVQERLIDLLDGKIVAPAPVIAADAPPETHPDTRRFLLLGDGEGGDAEVARLFTEPRPVWVNFLHPAQQILVDTRFRGPAKISGAAGTGKTVVALHRARRLAREGRRVLFTTYVRTLLPEIGENLRLICTPDERARIDVRTVHSAAGRVLMQAGEEWKALNEYEWLPRVRVAVRSTGCSLDAAFVEAEREAVIEAQDIRSWEHYRTASRRGRGVPLSVIERKEIWDAVARLTERAEADGVTTYAGLCARATAALHTGIAGSPYSAVIVDEMQDLEPQALRFVAALAGTGIDTLCLVGDAGQRIYQRPTSLRACGIEVRGRSNVLRVNYRTTHEIRRFADALLGDVPDEDDEQHVGRRGRSVMRGPQPRLAGFSDTKTQDAALVEAIRSLVLPDIDDPTPFGEIAVFAPTNACAERVYGVLRAADIPVRLLHMADRKGGDGDVSVGTIHRAKGLEYRAIFTVDITEGVINRPPDADVLDERDRADHARRQRHLLYVSLTRARNELYIYWVGEPYGRLLEVMTMPGASLIAETEL